MQPSRKLAANKLGIAFIGFGEVGQRFARDFAQRPDVALSAYDIVFASSRGDAHKARAAELETVTAADAASACGNAMIIISAVTADQALAVATSAAQFLKPGQIFLDVNSASPSTKRAAAKVVEASGATYVEGAVMGAVKGPGITVEILAGGPGAHRAADLLNPLGMKLDPVSVDHGKASAIKLCRSIMIKGMEALIVDCARATKHWGVEDPVYASLAQTFPSIDWPALADDMAERVATHGIRRSAEMREAAEMLRDMSLDPSLAAAIADAQQRGAKPKA